MATIRVTARTAAARERLRRLAVALDARAVDRVIDRAAFMTQAALIRATPKKWFGHVRRGWFVAKPIEGARVIFNRNPVMLFLEAGTRGHGPRQLFGPVRPGERRGKAALFIPLTRRAVNATAGTPEYAGVDQSTTHGASYWHGARAIIQRRHVARRGGSRTGRSVFIFGRDYILARRVRGIRARRIVAGERPKARARLKNLMTSFAKNAVKRP